MNRAVKIALLTVVGVPVAAIVAAIVGPQLPWIPGTALGYVAAVVLIFIFPGSGNSDEQAGHLL
jgi:hypothetical protein